MLNQTGIVPTLQVGGRVFTDLQNLITLVASNFNTGANSKSSFRIQDALSGYAVPVGKRLRILAVTVQGLYSAAGTAALCRIGYADNDVGMATNVAYVNQRYPYNNLDCGIVGGNALNSGGLQFLPFDFTVPAGKYVSLENAVNAQIVVRVYGYLEDV